MESLKYLYRIGRGPSSSHTMGPNNACIYFLNRYKNINHVKVTLYGSLAFTGKGHLTDEIIIKTFDKIPCEVIFDYKTEKEFANTMLFEVFLDSGEIITKEIYSIGGGAIKFKGDDDFVHPDIYKEKNLSEIINVCKQNNWRIYEYCYKCEGEEIKDYLRLVWHTMLDSINRGIHATGKLPGKLNIDRKANMFLNPNHDNESIPSRSYRLMSCYAFAVGEENASGGIIVTAPTCGSAGVLPAALYSYKHDVGVSEKEIIKCLAVAGLIGLIIKIKMFIRIR